MPARRGAHPFDLNDAVRHDNLRQARILKRTLRAGDGPTTGQRDPNRETRGQKGPTTTQVAAAARLAAGYMTGSVCAGRTVPMAVTESPSVTVAKLAMS